MLGRESKIGMGVVEDHSTWAQEVGSRTSCWAQVGMYVQVYASRLCSVVACQVLSDKEKCVEY